jgi:hypothetical protein
LTDICQKIVDDVVDGDVVNVQLISFNEEQQQIEWPLELRQTDLICGMYCHGLGGQN